jgi:hypothetical protein
MSPIYLSIVGKSKFIYNKEIRSLVMEQYHYLIEKIVANSTIFFSDRVRSRDDVDDLIKFLTQHGIPKKDLRIHYSSRTGQDELEAILQYSLDRSGLTFGEDVAERDEGLDTYFITTEAFKSVLKHEKHIIIGPKGSGKSAILRQVSSNETNSLTITPEHYATDVLEVLRSKRISTDLTAFITTWKYTLLVEIFKKLVTNQIGDAKALLDLRKYLVEHGHMGSELSMLERFLDYLRRITQIKGKVGPVEGEIGLDPVDELGKLFKMDELLGLIPSLRKALRRTEFTVFIDELDQSWNNTDTANQFLISLLTAAIQLRGISENLHVVVFLRSEIFDLLKPFLPQLDKLRSDIESIQWSRRELVNLIVSRALNSMRIGDDINAETAIKVLFPADISAYSTISSFDYLLSRTSFRPREVIQFCNLALKEAIDLDQSYIGMDAILRAEETFSIWKREHITAENMYIYPGLDKVLESFRGQSRKLSHDAISYLLEGIILQAEENGSLPYWLREGMESVDLLRLLYTLEIIGIERTSANTTPITKTWEAYDFVYRRPGGRPEVSASFIYHPGLWKGLEMV